MGRWLDPQKVGVMKFKTTAKAIRNNCYNVVSAGYCDLQYLLSYENPVAYTSGVYGWNFDVYEVNGLTICTGYRGMVGKRAKGINEFENRAKQAMNLYKDEDARKRVITLLLAEFCRLNKE